MQLLIATIIKEGGNMVIVFIIVCIILLIILLSSIHLKIEKLVVSNENITNKIKFEYSAFLELFFINKIKILSIKIDEKKLKRLNIKQKIKNMNLKRDMFSKKEIKKILDILNINLSEVNINLKIGTQNAIFTSAIVTIISTILGIVLAKLIKKYDRSKHKYEIIPIYQNENQIKLFLNCIIQVKLVHIICVIYLLIKKRRVKKNGRASNRRTYDYSYE